MSAREKIEITAKATRIASFGGMLNVLTTILCWYYNVIKYDIKLGNLNTSSGLIDFINDWNKPADKVVCLFLCAFQWLSIPFLIYFLEVMTLMQNSLLKISYINKRFINIFSILLITISSILPVPLVISRIFEWNFIDDDGNNILSGYFIQLTLIRLNIILLDCIMIPLIFINLIHWELVLRKKRKIFCCISILIAFGGFVQLFGWQDDGFFSVHGASQYFSLPVYCGFISIGIWMLIHQYDNKLKYRSVSVTSDMTDM